MLTFFSLVLSISELYLPIYSVTLTKSTFANTVGIPIVYKDNEKCTFFLKNKMLDDAI